MPKALVLGNGNILATFDDNLLLNDFHYPQVGMEDHTTYQKYHRIGVWVDGAFSWLSKEDWDISIDYMEDTLVSNADATNHALNVSLHFEDFVYTTRDILFRKLIVKNLSEDHAEIRLFFHHDFYIYGEKFQDTAEYNPENNSVLHYCKRRYFMINGMWDDGTGMDQYTVGKSNFGNLEGTFRDAEDGELSGHPIEQGSVDSTVRFKNNFTPGESKLLYVWLCAAKRYEETRRLEERVFELSPLTIYKHTREYWRKWVNKEEFDYDALPKEVITLFKKSLLIIRTQIDNEGAIIASSDNDIMRFNKDTYTYMWPRDSALVTMALCDAGYEVQARNFFNFCKKVVTKDGYLLNKYHPDGSLGSSWHPKIKNGEAQLPIQEDESALVLVALEHYYRRFKFIEIIQELFDPLILKIGRWMCSYTDPKTGLPLPSYDLWEEHRQVHSYTTATVYAGLRAASYLSEATGHLGSAEVFMKKANNVKDAMLKYLYSETDGRFYKNIALKHGNVVHTNNTVDASLSFVWSMGVLPTNDKRVRQTMEAINMHLGVPTNIGGIARFSNDHYHFDHDTVDMNSITGNPWIITTLWENDYRVENAKSRRELKKCVETFKWVCDRTNKAGILPEQAHPLTGAPLSVAPLTWSHSTFVASVLRYLKKYNALKQ